MQNSTSYKPTKIVSDIDVKYLTNEQAFFILNQQKNAQGKTRPMFGNAIMDTIVQPVGDNYSIGSYYSELTNETYTLHWNSLGNHFVSRINSLGVDIVCQMVCLPIDIDPAHAMQQWRGYLIYQPEKDGTNGIYGKYFVFTTGKGFIAFIDVELSIQTNSFNLEVFQKCVFNPCDYITLEVRQPQQCITASIKGGVDELKTNMILDQVFQFRYKYEYYDGRQSEWSTISIPYWLDRPRFATDSEFSRCFILNIPAGNAMVVKIHLAYRQDNTNNWLETDIIEKYGSYPVDLGYYDYGGGTIGGGVDNPWWYMRNIILPDYNEDDCSFKYEFCADKRCDPIPPEETVRLFNPWTRDTQALLPLDNRLAFFNGVLNEDPVPKEQLDKVKFEVSRLNNDCIPEMVTLRVSAHIINQSDTTAFKRTVNSQFIYRLNGTANGVDDKKDVAYFGGLYGVGAAGVIIGAGLGVIVGGVVGGVVAGVTIGVANGEIKLSSDSQQSFREETRNFIAYVSGTEFWCTMEQYRVLPDGTLEKCGVLANMGDKNTREKEVQSNYQYLQIGEIKVPKGSHGFIRLASNEATGNDQNGSTFLSGVRELIDNRLSGGLFSEDKEIYFDACGPEKILDLTHKSFEILDCASARYAIYGYITDNNGNPIPNAHIDFGASEHKTVAEVDSDHNGFYFYAGVGFRHEAKVNIEQGTLGGGSYAVMYTIPKNISKHKNWVLHNVKIDDADYAENYQHRLVVKVEDCTGQPVSGVKVSVESHRPVETGFDGIAKISVRNTPYGDYVFNGGERPQKIRIAVMHTGGYLFRDCDGNCNPCMFTIETVTPESYQTVTTTDLGTTQIKILFITEKGLKSGGRYEGGFALIGHGRMSFVQENKYFFDMPTIQQKQNYDLYGVSVVIDPSFLTWLQVNKPWVEYVSFFRTKNLKHQDYLQWVVDKIEYVDSTGKEATKFSATNIRLTIQSLNDYNANYFFKSNTVYQYTAGDRVEIISNGDGTIYTEMINMTVKSPHYKAEYDTIYKPKEKEPPADYFNQILIENDPRLGDFKEGALIELQKEKICEVKNRYQEICSPVLVRSLKGTINLPTFDTYRQSRIIPDHPSFFTFEHHSITDFWGTKIDDQGRLHTSNPYEKEERFGRDLWLTDAWAYNGNYLGTNKFRETQIKRFAGIEMGDLIAATIRNARTMLFICQHDNFISSIGDDIPRVGKDGTLQVNASSNFLSDPQEKGGDFGCSYEAIGSIMFGRGFATWIDTVRDIPGFIMHNFQSAADVSFEKTQRWFQRVIKMFKVYNATAAPLDKYRFAAGYNTWSSNVMVTVKRLNLPGINNVHDDTGENKTICFNPMTGDFTSYHACTPESYATFIHAEKNSYVVYFRGQPWLHSSEQPRNTFFGVATDRVIGFCLNEIPIKEKQAKSIEIQSDKMYFVEKVTTDKENFISEIPPIRVKHKMNHWSAEFLGNAFSIGGLYKGAPCRGYQIAITLVRDNTDQLKYGTIDPARQVEDDELDIIIVKHEIVESSGLTHK